MVCLRVVTFGGDEMTRSPTHVRQNNNRIIFIYRYNITKYLKNNCLLISQKYLKFSFEVSFCFFAFAFACFCRILLSFFFHNFYFSLNSHYSTRSAPDCNKSINWGQACKQIELVNYKGAIVMHTKNSNTITIRQRKVATKCIWGFFLSIINVSLRSSFAAQAWL